jgi:cell division protein FtsW
MKTSYGASYSRYLKIGAVYFQPSLLAACATILLLAVITERCYRKMSTLKYILTVWGTAGIMAALILGVANHTIYAGLVCLVAFAMTMYFTRKYLFHITLLVVSGISLFAAFLNLPSSSYAAQRLLSWLSPGDYDFASSTIRALMSATAFSTSGFDYSLLTSGWIDILYDNIFVLMYNCYGWLGAIIIVGEYMYLLFELRKLMRSNFQTNNMFAASICLGVAVHIGALAMFHMGMNLNLLPIVSCPLPLISDWRSLYIPLELAIALSVSRNVK